MESEQAEWENILDSGDREKDVDKDAPERREESERRDETSEGDEIQKNSLSQIVTESETKVQLQQANPEENDLIHTKEKA